MQDKQLVLWFDPSRGNGPLQEMTPTKDLKVRSIMAGIASQQGEAVFCNRLLAGPLLLGCPDAVRMLGFHLPWLLSLAGEHCHELASSVGSGEPRFLRAVAVGGSIAVHVSKDGSRKAAAKSRKLCRKMLCLTR